MCLPDALAESDTSLGLPNLMADEGSIHLTMSETVMATLSLLSLVYKDVMQPFSLYSPLITPLLSPFITGSPNRRDRLIVWRYAPFHSVQEQPLLYGVHSLASCLVCHCSGHFNWPINFWKGFSGCLDWVFLYSLFLFFEPFFEFMWIFFLLLAVLHTLTLSESLRFQPVKKWEEFCE